MERLSHEFKTINHRLWFLNVNSSIMKAIGFLGEIESFQIIHKEENIVEYFQDIRKRASDSQIHLATNTIHFKNNETNKLRRENEMFVGKFCTRVKNYYFKLEYTIFR